MGPTTLAEHTGRFPLLRRTELRNMLTEDQLRDLERFCRSTTRKPGVTLFRQGEPADTFYLLAEGTVELRAKPPGRRVYRTIELLGASCTFGDEAILGEPRYLASARVLEAARLCSLPRASFERLASANPDVALGVVRSAGSCLIRTVRRAAILTQAPADVGLRLLLQELAAGLDGGSAPVRITHAQLAGVLHVSRETVSRMLRQLSDEGIVELGRGMIRVAASE
jgi:CRP-like cAMP-binding protein